MFIGIANVDYYSHFIDEKTKALRGHITQGAPRLGHVRKKLKKLQQLRFGERRPDLRRVLGGAQEGVGVQPGGRAPG